MKAPIILLFLLSGCGLTRPKVTPGFYEYIGDGWRATEDKKTGQVLILYTNARARENAMETLCERKNFYCAPEFIGEMVRVERTKK